MSSSMLGRATLRAHLRRFCSAVRISINCKRFLKDTLVQLSGNVLAHPDSRVTLERSGVVKQMTNSTSLTRRLDPNRQMS